jgi:diguanylate cyclase (GGDEF)-like protein
VSQALVTELPVKTWTETADTPDVSDGSLEKRPGTGNIPQAGILSVLAAVHVAGLAISPVMVSGPALAVLIVAEVIAALAAAAALAVRVGRRHPLGDTLILAVLILAALGSAVRMGVTGSPWAGMDLLLILLAAAALSVQRNFVIAVGWSVLAWVAAAAVAVDTGARTWSAWGTSAVVVAAAAGLVAVMRAGVQALERTLDEVRENAASEAVRDSLTGAVNRRGLEMLGLPLVENARRQGEAVHCLFVDVDDFKGVNASAGFEFADQVLITVTEAISSSVRATDSVARWSADQFVVVGPGTGTSPLELERRVRARFAHLDPGPGATWKGRVSIGSATLVPWDEGGLDELIGRAEQDMRLRRSLRRQGAERAAAGRGRRPRSGTNTGAEDIVPGRSGGSNGTGEPERRQGES